MFLTEYFDHENNNTTVQNYTAFQQWNVQGAVDLIGAGSNINEDFFPNHGIYVDLGGSNGQFGGLTSKAVFAAGDYEIRFTLGGTGRGPTDGVTVKMGGDYEESFIVGSTAVQTHSVHVRLNTPGQLSFSDMGLSGDPNVGVSLIDVLVLRDELNAGDQRNPAGVQLDNGNFAFVFSDTHYFANGGNTDHSDSLSVAIIDIAGNLVGGSKDFEADTGVAVPQRASIAQIGPNEFAVAYYIEDGSHRVIRVQNFDELGHKLGVARQLEGFFDGAQPIIHATPDSGFIVGGVRNNSQGHFSIELFKFNLLGTITATGTLDDVAFDGLPRLNDIQVAPDGTIYVNIDGPIGPDRQSIILTAFVNNPGDLIQNVAPGGTATAPNTPGSVTRMYGASLADQGAAPASSGNNIATMAAPFAQANGVGTTFIGGPGTTIAIAFAGDNTFQGGSGVNDFTGGSGDDLFLAGLGINGFDGKGGINTASWENVPSGISLTVDLSGMNDLVSSAGDAIKNIQLFNLSDADDSFTASTTPDDGPAFGLTIFGLGGSDAIIGTNHDDTLIGGGSNDFLRGGAGSDTASYASSTVGVTINLATNVNTGGEAAGDVLQEVENVLGTAFADTLTGDGADNKFEGGAGPDTMEGGTGSDTLSYASSALAVTVNLATNTVSGGDANGDVISNFDNVMGSAGNDNLTGTAGDNLLDGNGGDDTMTGGAGNDTYVVSTANSVITENPGEGTDTVRTNLANFALGFTFENLIFTGSAAHTGSGNSSNNVMTGSTGNDTFFAGMGSDTLDGGDGNDVLVGNAGGADLFTAIQDAFDGGAGNDTLYVKAGDVIQGGADRDFLHLVNDHAITINLGSTGIEWIETLFGNDTIDGSTQTVGIEVYSDGGNDTITGSAFNDIVWAGSGNDMLTGGDGNDALIGDIGSDSISGGNGNDTFFIDSDDTFIDGGVGFDNAYITSGQGMSIDLAATRLEWVADFVGGNDTMDGSGATANLEIYAAGGTDSVTGGSGADFVWGEAGNDTLTGNGGNDTLVGGTGTDRMTGGLGTDALYGNSGNGGDNVLDTFVFTDGWGTDFVIDFEHNIDKLDLTAVTGVNTFSDLTLTNTPDGHCYVTFGGNLIALSGMAGQITESDFLL